MVDDGPGTGPPIVIRGIMQRSGTNFLLGALCPHPDVGPAAFAIRNRRSWRRLPVRGSSFLDGPKVQARPEHFKPVGRWRGWSRRQRRTFEREAGQAMTLLGYHTSWADHE